MPQLVVQHTRRAQSVTVAMMVGAVAVAGWFALWEGTSGTSQHDCVYISKTWPYRLQRVGRFAMGEGRMPCGGGGATQTIVCRHPPGWR